MFSGIVETQAVVLESVSSPPSVKLKLQRPSGFTDLSIGDSISVNGICLTLEEFSPEALNITGGTAFWQKGRSMNMERSLQVGSRLHGHFVSGHVDEMGRVESVEKLGESLELWISCSKDFRPLLWKKGSVTVNGVSLTVNQILGSKFQVVLIPETLRRTNLSHLVVADRVCLEADFFARGVNNYLQQKELQT
jgi:riboflavin synthase